MKIVSIEKLKKEYISVEGSYGGNQRWLRKDADKANTLSDYGCGLISANDVLLHLSDKSNNTSKEKYIAAIREMNRRYFHVLPFLGVSGIMLSFYMRIYFFMHRKHFDKRYKVRWGVLPKKQLNCIKEMIENDIPVILSIGPGLIRGRKKELPLYSLKQFTVPDTNKTSPNKYSDDTNNLINDNISCKANDITNDNINSKAKHLINDNTSSKAKHLINDNTSSKTNDITNDNISGKTNDITNDNINNGTNDRISDNIEFTQVNSVKDHYVNITGVIECEGSNYTPMLEISSWGKKYYINYNEYRDFVKRHDNYLFSNILYIHP